MQQRVKIEKLLKLSVLTQHTLLTVITEADNSEISMKADKITMLTNVMTFKVSSGVV